MSIGGDEYDEQRRTGGAGTSTRRGPTLGTRTRLPGEDGDVYGVGRRPAGRPGRSLLMVVSVVVLLIAAIAFANRNDSSGSVDEQTDGSSGGGAQPTAPTGEMPVQGKDTATGIPSGFPQTRQGAQSAAANYAVALGSAEMFDPSQRAAILTAVMAPSSVDEYRTTLDKAYSPQFFENVGLNQEGAAPAGTTFVSRTVPIGTQAAKFEEDAATIEVWCTGLQGLAGADSTVPVTTEWFTITFELAWIGGDWKSEAHSQKEGPAPVSGDTRVSKDDVIADAVKGYGGFTYAR